MSFEDYRFGAIIMRTGYLLLLSAIVFGAACRNDSPPLGSGDGDGPAWLVPSEEVVDGGVGKDGIPAISNPEFLSAAAADYLKDEDLVVGILIGDEARAYPHRILDWHEVVNDQIEDIYFSITFCPLTGSGIGWNRRLNGLRTTFGVSGLLYNSNLILYDRATDSNWSQMGLQCVNGLWVGQAVEIVPTLETTWSTWREMYPKTRALNNQSDFFFHTYQYSYYLDYRTNNDYIVFPVNEEDRRLPLKERVHGLIAGETSRAYPVKSFPDSIETINDELAGISVVVVGSGLKNFALSFERALADGTILSFQPVQDELPVVMIDNEGTRWDTFGQATDGPRKGEKLKATTSYIAYWFAWAAFHPETDIFAGQ
jgi:hypothetical protein